MVSAARHKPPSVEQVRWIGAVYFAILVLWAATASSYDDPVQDAYLSTVIGTGTANEGTLPKQVPTRMR